MDKEKAIKRAALAGVIAALFACGNVFLAWKLSMAVFGWTLGPWGFIIGVICFALFYTIVIVVGRIVYSSLTREGYDSDGL